MNRAPQAEQDRESPQRTGHDASDAFDDLPLPAIEMDSCGVVTRANRATLALHPPERGELVGKMVWDFMAADEKDPSFAAYCETIETGAAPERVRRSLYDRSGTFRTYDLHRKMIHDSLGMPAGMRVIFVDVTDQVKALEAANGSRLWLESILESVCEAVIVTDSVGFIREENPAARKLLEAREDELAGMLIEDGLPVVSYTSGDRTTLHFNCSLEAPLKGAATVLTRAQKEIEVELSTSPIFEKETGSTIGVVYVLRAV